jgi:AcrR family transcriptional regulator
MVNKGLSGFVMASDTKTRILEAARALFNAEGYAGLSAMDVATALAISPGHLYYHFKGKSEIAAALLAAHEAEMAGLLAQARSDCASGDVETLWTHVHILIEETFDVRFAYRDGQLEPALRPGLARLRSGAIAAMNAILSDLAQRGRLSASPEAVSGLAQAIALGLAHQAPVLELESKTEPPRALVARAAALVMLPAAGYAAKTKTPSPVKERGQGVRTKKKR